MEWCAFPAEVGSSRMPVACRPRVDNCTLNGGHGRGSGSVGLRLVMTAVVSVAAKMNEWVKKTEVDGGKPVGVPAEVAEKLKALEREKVNKRRLGLRDGATGGLASNRPATGAECHPSRGWDVGQHAAAAQPVQIRRRPLQFIA